MFKCINKSDKKLCEPSIPFDKFNLRKILEEGNEVSLSIGGPWLSTSNS